ncbi:MAG: hypothetical protein U9Q05_03870 [Thermodesulfobacteriota bacterium]|nr:hypothetical protein [Thermodesulfobacteriota bacterium]
MVKLDRQSVSRKTIIPWYDSESACLVIIILMFFVFMFGYIGLSLARETSVYQGHSWMPILLMAASGIIILSITIRLIRRYIARHFP